MGKILTLLAGVCGMLPQLAYGGHYARYHYRHHHSHSSVDTRSVPVERHTSERVWQGTPPIRYQYAVGNAVAEVYSGWSPYLYDRLCKPMTLQWLETKARSLD